MNHKQHSIHKLPMKIISAVLAALIVFSTGMISCYAQGLGVFDKMETEEILSDYADEIIDTDGVRSVDTEHSGENELYLNMKDGSTTVYAFAEPVLYTDDNGKLRFKDNAIVKQENKEKADLGYDYSNTQNDYEIHISSDSAKGVLAEYGDISFSINPIAENASKGAVSKEEKNGKEYENFEYPDVFGKGASLKYFLQLNGIKEEVILDQNINQNKFSFLLTTTNCTPVLNEDGSISLLDQNEEEVQRFTAPFGDEEYKSSSFNFTNKVSYMAANKYLT